MQFHVSDQFIYYLQCYFIEKRSQRISVTLVKIDHNINVIAAVTPLT
jgi:hypothetical protein